MSPGLDQVGIHDVGGLGDGGVSSARGNDQPSDLPLILVNTSPFVASCCQCGQIAGRAAADEYAARLGGESREVGYPAQSLIFCINASSALKPSTAKNAGGADDKIKKCGCFGGGRGHEGEQARVVDRNACRRKHVGE